VLIYRQRNIRAETEVRDGSRQRILKCNSCPFKLLVKTTSSQPSLAILSHSIIVKSIPIPRKHNTSFLRITPPIKPKERIARSEGLEAGNLPYNRMIDRPITILHNAPDDRNDWAFGAEICLSVGPHCMCRVEFDVATSLVLDEQLHGSVSELVKDTY
jgi:hypothetical protein